MDCAPLNLAHFHERRADKFIKHHRYEDAHNAVETSLLYLQDAYKKVLLPKSIEVLNTQKWEYERKLRQIQIRKQQYERFKHKGIVPDTISVHVRADGTVVSAQLAAKSIDKTVKEFDVKFNSMMVEQNVNCLKLNKENCDPRGAACASAGDTDPRPTKLCAKSKPKQPAQPAAEPATYTYDFEDNDELPTLAPLELPAFDFNLFTTAAPSLAGTADLVENFQK